MAYPSHLPSTALPLCVSSLQSSLALLSSSIAILDASTADFSRLSKVLQTTRVRLLFLYYPSPSNPTNSQP